MSLRFGSLFSGIEAASVAWLPLGWECAWLAEIEPFPCAVLAHHYPEVVNLGDVTAKSFFFSPRNRAWCDDYDFEEKAKCLGPVDLVCGGSPCQAFSVAGLRRSLADDRGNLTLRFVEIVNAIDPRFVLWENVPGVFSTRDNAFGCLLAGLVGEDAPIVPTGGRWTDAGVVDGPRRTVAWRVLDAQYFGLAQRRRRVFLLAGRAGDRPHPGEVLFEPESLRRHSAPGRASGQEVARSLTSSASNGGSRYDGDSATFVTALTSRGVGVSGADDNQAQAGHLVATSLRARDMAKGVDSDCTDTLIAHTLRGRGFDASEDGCGRGIPLVCSTLDASYGQKHGVTNQDANHGYSHLVTMGFHSRQDPIHAKDVSLPLERQGGQAVAISLRGREGGSTAEMGGEIMPAVRASQGGGDKPHVMADMAVRRLTPREAERLMGFPDDYTLIPRAGKPAEDCPNGPRYRALGNSWAVPVARWIGARLERLIAQTKEAA
ncbi:MAG: DNA cytosine methyltransferase [Thermodesulfobacteriota bacterium]